MRTNTRRIVFMLLLAVCVSVSVTAETPKNVLIVTDGSSFKAKTIKNVRKLSEGTGIEYRVLDIKKITEANAENFDRYVILCKLTGGRVEQKAYAYYQTLDDTTAILIGMTYAFDGPMPENAKREIGDIDAVTAASKNANVDAFARKIADWIIAEN